MREFLIAFFVTFIVNSDGFINVVRERHIPGSLNYVRIILIFLAAVGVLAITIQVSRKCSVLARIYFSMVALLCSLMLVFAIKGNFFIGIYDSICIATFLIICGFSLMDQIWNFANWGRIFSFVIIMHVNISLLPILFDQHLDALGRFSGLITTSSIFGSATAILYLGYTKFTKKTDFRNLIVTASLIYFSGTRTAFLQLFGALFPYLKRSNREAIKFLLALAIFISIGVLSVNFGWIVLPDQIRVLELNNVNEDSFRTRLYWYSSAWSYLSSTSFMGGAGSGHSRELAGGALLHFDLLRLWVDYGIIVTLSVFLMTIFAAKANKGEHWWIYFISVFFLPLFHNSLQAPEILFICALVIASRKRRERVGDP
jgi:hypothetical protein